MRSQNLYLNYRVATFIGNCMYSGIHSIIYIYNAILYSEVGSLLLSIVGIRNFFFGDAVAFTAVSSSPRATPL